MGMNVLSLIVSIMGLFFTVLVTAVSLTAIFYKTKQELIGCKQEILNKLEKYMERIEKQLDVLVSHQKEKNDEEKMMKMLNIRTYTNIRSDILSLLIEEHDPKMERNVKSQAVELNITNDVANRPK